MHLKMLMRRNGWSCQVLIRQAGWATKPRDTAIS